MDNNNNTPFLGIPDGDEVDIPNHEDPQMMPDEYILTSLILVDTELTRLRGLDWPLNELEFRNWHAIDQSLWELQWHNAIAEPGSSTFLPSTIEHIRQLRSRIIELFLEFGDEEPVPEDEFQGEAATAVQNLGPRPYVVGESDNVRCAVCMEDWDEGCQVVELKCFKSHILHVTCAEQSFQFSMRCPYCRAEVTVTNEED
ncbi:hypothetical protein CROQUDRAFT_626582 [Cronartium quercuum f. sp. fusiforme G11]|uniref:RING-type domain-containing protein n=1 Tax=Cronartium quercuum f. sp. fusiforme G11 TaxID=708437 RepID=A0A9P6NCY5_9BASI|nr:hypothetical protein CROQUDRAFT_626582 [Cronartium quercuum f. sp. fusiforme G11]